ncbi:uncharacterized protein OCT59_017309 [Rhizophagus irregularis]|uniref:NAD(P)-binding domain-containing protein n=2 Tax=Rhizophagus irregularis TaxID=588596 RepID=U9TRL1_RHIID|nr:hypothetical protein GLOIN_2v1721207 [Rhizophagus irregularis DAOM 181602=DAOM 197198]EXX59557.1 hypothetical protein RirG_187880 [Rhizophagus irregularis DAOM 197198w]UZO25020.1 hypothetical protein OCT59_017309 [Rhizophagus irregularis]POG59570.1 hypothetical protein GLOIN_2v1721207 [Rhizophagus irregularis DAOM 181602=DAOM 197198]CAG8494663.1 18583_t:CDS:2 [Rhizophagus irregularis]GBC50265.2 SDR family oxidoreductase [Rhizophagus irregularis DAOM 181602=DAOM 197198]|eukprot:XP_025166436.1 hypothetical protein GLOIN_2v1721207 [Rhizophagus irregularis DAOM 181602=DAOM 197198]
MSRDFKTYRKSLSVDILFPPPLAITKDKQLSAKIKLRPYNFILKSIRGKNLLVLGATGDLGFQVMSQALEASYHVTILIRNDKNLPFESHHLRNPNLVIITGSVLSREDMNKAVEGQDAIINCLGPRALWTSDIDICSRSQRIIIESMKFYGVKRIIVVTSQGISGNDKQVGRIQSFFGFNFTGKVISDKELQERYIKENSDFLDWTIIRPGKLYNGELTGHYKLNENFALMKISRANVAHFILKELQTGIWLKRTPTINGY